MKKERLVFVGLLLILLAALLLAGCQRSAHPPVYEVEVRVTLADGYWGDPPEVVEVAILKYTPGVEMLVSSEAVSWRESSAVSFQWAEAGHYTIHVEAVRDRGDGEPETFAVGAEGMDVPADRPTEVAIHRTK